MRRTRFDSAHCPIARTTDLLGDWWTPLVLRELFFGRRRFDQFTDSLGISRAVLSQRLKRLEAEGIISTRRYQDHPPRVDYVLTDKGLALWEVMAAMWRFGEDWMFDGAGAEVELVDKRTGETVMPRTVDETTGQPLDLASTRIRRKRSGGGDQRSATAASASG